MKDLNFDFLEENEFQHQGSSKLITIFETPSNWGLQKMSSSGKISQQILN